MNNWYAVYTKVNGEKKVISQLTRKKMNFCCPMNRHSQISRFRKKSSVEYPLFPGIIFVEADAGSAQELTRLNGVENLLYWLGTPARISDLEIEALQQFTCNYPGIRVDKIPVNVHIRPELTFEKQVSLSGNRVNVTGQIARLELPVIGFRLEAPVTGAFPEIHPVLQQQQLTASLS